jgi:hypothetical protein
VCQTLLVVVVAALLGAPAATAQVDPGRLVLRQADVPAGFRLQPRESGVRTNALESREAEARRLIARSGRRIGYQTRFDRAGRTIQSRADLCRNARGARVFLGAIDDEMRKGGIRGLVRLRVGLGGGGWLYTGRVEPAFVLVVWSYRRAFAGVVTTGLSRAATLALARKQQRRIADALR